MTGALSVIETARGNGVKQKLKTNFNNNMDKEMRVIRQSEISRGKFSEKERDSKHEMDSVKNLC